MKKLDRIETKLTVSGGPFGRVTLDTLAQIAKVIMWLINHENDTRVNMNSMVDEINALKKQVKELQDAAKPTRVLSLTVDDPAEDY